MSSQCKGPAELIFKSELTSRRTGTEGGGNMFPGVTMPFGMVKIGIDLEPPGRRGGDAYSGYLPNGQVLGFSMMHESGTGGAPKYGVVSQLPIVGDVKNPLADWSTTRTREDEAEVGLYTAYLDKDVTVKLTSTHHVGAIRYHFGKEETVNVMIDVSHFLHSFRGMREIEQKYHGGLIRLKDNGGYEGFGMYSGGWNMAPEWKIYFCGRFKEPHASVKAFSGQGGKTTWYNNSKFADAPNGATRVGAVYTFKNGENGTDIESRIGISFISEKRACEFLEDEGDFDHTFEELVSEVKKEWNREILSTITTTTEDVGRLELLYTAMYGAFLIPSDRTGENPLWESEEPYYDDIFTLWDLFRCHSPLNHLLLPERYEGQIRSIIDIWRHDGFMPDGRSSNYNGRVQGGSNSDNVLADAFIKGLKGGINWEDGFKAMQTNAEVVPPNNFDPTSRDSSTKEGRGALPDWKERGYITPKYRRSASRAVEYALNDFSLAQVAKGLDKPDEEYKYLKRSRNWRNHWHANSTAFDEFSGYISIRYEDGTWPIPEHFNPLSCGGCYWGNDFYQGSPYEYSFGALHDMETLITYSGGAEKFTKKLEKMFELNNNRMIFNVGNEPSFASPYLFNFAGRQDLTAKTARFITDRYYRVAKNGIPGNSDAGAMQSFLIWNILGLYPITTTTTFLIASPWLPSVTIKPQTLTNSTRATTIETTGGDVPGAIYIQSVTLNGQPWTKNWITWDDLFANGGKLSMVMGTEPKRWDTGPLPPSYATGGDPAVIVPNSVYNV